MTDIPIYKLFGEEDPDVQAVLRPDIGYRDWNDLKDEEKEIAIRELWNNRFILTSGRQILDTITFLNYRYLALCPGKNLHNFSRKDSYKTLQMEKEEAAIKDFLDILKNGSSEIVMVMFSKWLHCFINEEKLENKNEGALVPDTELIDSAYKNFDVIAKSLNHIFEQFSIKWEITRYEFIPRQEKKISELVYQPTLKILSDPKWQSVNSDLSKMFDDFQNAKYSETIAKAHSAVQRFLQVIIGEEGKNGKGNFGQLFSEAKKNGLISANQFTEPVINAMQRYIPSERANNSTAKPAVKDATYSDALLMMNVVMVLIQHCLQNLKDGTV